MTSCLTTCLQNLNWAQNLSRFRFECEWQISRVSRHFAQTGEAGLGVSVLWGRCEVSEAVQWGKWGQYYVVWRSDGVICDKENRESRFIDHILNGTIVVGIVLEENIQFRYVNPWPLWPIVTSDFSGAIISLLLQTSRIYMSLQNRNDSFGKGCDHPFVMKISFSGKIRT